MSAAPAAPTAEFLEVQGLKAGTDPDKREVHGLALPYGEDLERPDWMSGATRQRFEKGSAVVRDNATLFYGHDHMSDGLPIGRITATEDTDDGLRITARISATPKGDEVYTLLKDGVLDRFSIGFYRAENHLEDTGTDNPVLVHTSIDVFETSVVPDPAFSSARIDSVLSRSTTQKETAMPETITSEQLDTLSENITSQASAIESLERRLATLGNTNPEPAISVPGSSYGDFIKMAAAGDSEALDFLARVAEDPSFLAYTGGVIDDLGDIVKDSWVGERFKLVEAQRTTLNFFARSPLPADGMGVEYAKLKSDTTQVAKQAAEGDTLAYGKVEWETARAALETYGGWGDMSRQQIERSPVNVVERFFSFLLNRYAATTEAKVNATATAGGVALTGGVLDLATADGWTKFVIRAAKVLKDLGYPLEGLLVGWDVFEDLAVLRDGDSTDGPRLLDRNTGKIQITGLKGEMFDIPVIPIATGATTDVVRAANSEAIRTYEAAGAPFRLQDDDITNLTKAFSIYGYMATAEEVPGAIVKPQTV